MTNEVLLDTLDDLSYRIDSVSTIADELRALIADIQQDDYHPYGTIVKAKPNQTRFKPKSVWVSLGNGNYQHLTGKKGLIATYDRLKDYVDVVFQA
jgi:hypothetical protein